MKGPLPVTLVAGLALALAPAAALADTTDVAGSVPSTLALTLGPAVDFGPFTPGIGKDYGSTMTAGVVSTAGRATLSVSDAGPNAGHLVNGSYVMPSTLQVRASSPAGAGGPFAALGAAPTTLLTYGAPVSNDPVMLGFQQHVDANDALRTGA
jgi:hypothetical protein